MDMVVLAVELGQAGLEVGADGPHDLFQAGQVRVGEHPMPELRHEDQMGVEHENTVPACSDIAVIGHNPTV
ncbi:hypothetical protein GCM10010176_090480 [Nonomuraea spiralis]|nr:hypothetical protein GCM10010176_090480 [Nonomuraea spiralis]